MNNKNRLNWNVSVGILPLIAFIFLVSGCQPSTSERKASGPPPTQSDGSSSIGVAKEPMLAHRKHKYTNRLIDEKSPYLLQHAHNPVDWHAWGDEAFEKAKKENRPIFLSIGYSTCHWCHVMEKESFEDEEVAALLNKHFVPIKVDREERPDIDKVYMGVCMAMTGSGGWPLTVIMTPEKKPFFAGTYFPKEGRWGQSGLIEILKQINSQWENDPERIVQASDEITRLIQAQSAAVAGAELTQETLKKGYEQLRSQFDNRNGGFGSHPKFPTPHNLSFLLRWWKRSGKDDALAMVEKTLDSMARGGIYDHLGFGFHRYSVDARWLVPHFEKMLYDQAMLAITYMDAYQATGDERYRSVTEEIFKYVLRDMTSPEGAFYSAEDADSEGEEGKFYVWTPTEVRKILGEEAGEVFCRFYGITDSGNFEGGRSIIHIGTPIEEFARREAMEPARVKSVLEESSRRLFTEREKRIHPHKDDKILTDWNGLMIAALAKGAQAFDKAEYSKSAARAANFILRKLRRSDGRLLHRYRDGEAAIPGYLNDYAFFIWGLIELHEATFDVTYLKEALALNEEMLKLFWDKRDGGLFFSGEDNERLITNSKDVYDGAIPSGNSVAALNLLKLGHITGNGKLEKKAGQLMSSFSSQVTKYPAGYTQFLIALDFASGPAKEIVIAGDPKKEDTRRMLKAVRERFLPGTVVILHPPGKAGREIEKIAPFVKLQEPLGGKATAYVCQNYSCLLPTSSVEKLEALLDGRDIAR